MLKSYERFINESSKPIIINEGLFNKLFNKLNNYYKKHKAGAEIQKAIEEYKQKINKILYDKYKIDVGKMKVDEKEIEKANKVKQQAETTVESLLIEQVDATTQQIDPEQLSQISQILPKLFDEYGKELDIKLKAIIEKYKDTPGTKLLAELAKSQAKQEELDKIILYAKSTGNDKAIQNLQKIAEEERVKTERMDHFLNMIGTKAKFDLGDKKDLIAGDKYEYEKDGKKGEIFLQGTDLKDKTKAYARWSTESTDKLNIPEDEKDNLFVVDPQKLGEKISEGGIKLEKGNQYIYKKKNKEGEEVDVLVYCVDDKQNLVTIATEKDKNGNWILRDKNVIEDKIKGQGTPYKPEKPQENIERPKEQVDIEDSIKQMLDKAAEVQ